jgi:hypothetical protein
MIADVMPINVTIGVFGVWYRGEVDATGSFET